MEEMVIWEQYTVTLNRDPRKGFGIAISGGRDRPGGIDRDVSIVVSDVVQGGPAAGRLQTRDKIAMVNGLSMDNVSSSFAIQTLKTCGKVANITVKRARKVHLPVSKPSQPPSQAVSAAASRSPDDRNDDTEEERGPAGRLRPAARRHRPQPGLRRGFLQRKEFGRSREEESAPHRRQPLRSRRRSHEGVGGPRRRSQDSGSDRQPFTNGYSHGGDPGGGGLALMSGFKRLPKQDVLRNPSEYGLKLGSQIFIKHIAETGLAAKDSSLQEGDLILKVRSASEVSLGGEISRAALHSSCLGTISYRRGQYTNKPFLFVFFLGFSNPPDISDLGSDGSPPSPPPPTGRVPASPESPPPPDRNSSLLRRGSSRELGLGQDLSVTSVFDAEAALGDNDYGVHDSPGREDYGYSPDSKLVRFVKARSVGLRLAGGNDVGIFVASVQEGSPAESQGIMEGDQILQVNEKMFQNVTREEAVQFLMDLMPGEEVSLHLQRKQDIYRKMVKSNVSDSFYIRTHFDFEKDTPSGLSFTRGEVFHVIDTMYRGKMGSWLAIRMGKDLQEMDKGIIPNKNRAEQIASLEPVLKATAAAASGPRAEFWKLRGLRGARKNLRKSREDLSALTKQGRYPPYERVVLKEATFKRPVVILGPIADIAMEKLSTEMPDQFETAESVTREGESAKVIRLDTVWQISKKDKHALLDITPPAVERLNYVQYFPIVVFCEPESRQGVKAMRKWLAPESKKSSRRLYAQAGKMRKYWSHLFTATIHLADGSNTWYPSLKDIIRIQQGRPVWTTEEQVDVSADEGLDMLNPPSAATPGYLTCDSRANSDYEETDAEGEPYADHDLEEAYEEPALSRSSEPAEQSPETDLNERVAAALAYPVSRWDLGDQQPEGQWRQDYGTRDFEHEALRKKFTQARAYDSESDQDDGYDWGPATDL
ncbi:hypothetical protein JRQ81_008948 [Phrynocephalus forsythii]|uniref:Tight junction protein ZO-3 n=1 Tax=Phrynocephalus forsythii TaxID=171643 RepID=A0A9Q1AT41_9SAUR|nr:hypothetical protein JRQ81_008948 [Phrynocephalus forsythii]